MIQIGRRFHKLKVRAPAPSRGKVPYWFCDCKCGTKMHQSAATNLLSGRTTSCGCVKRVARVTHGKSGTSEYSIWKQMRGRCADKNNPNYGGRGIRVCSRWDKSFAAFLHDVGPRPSKEHTLERKDNDRGYAKSNCEWATQNTQTRNTRRNRILVYGGISMCLSDWAVKKGMPRERLRDRLEAGWSLEEALCT